MTKDEFMKELAEVLQLDETPDKSFMLTDQYWDSASQMAVMAFFLKQFGAHVAFEDLTMANTAGDLLDLANKYLTD